MRPRKCPAAEARIGIELSAFQDFADGTKVPVLELANIKIPASLWVLSPAEKNIARRLHCALTFDDTGALMGEIFWGRCKFFENRMQRLLDLQKQMLAIRGHEKADGAKCADASDADNF